jgi:integrase
MRKSFNMSLAMSQIVYQPAQELTFAELINAYCAVRCDDTDVRTRKWLDAFGARSAWDISTEELTVAHQSMIEHGYSTSAANRDVSTIGSIYRWAIDKRITPLGFKSPTVGVRRAPEPIRLVYVKQEKIDALRARALAFPDRRFGLFVSLLIDSGARKSELLERVWADVDLARQQIILPTSKNGKPRMLFFTDQTANLIRRMTSNKEAAKLIFEGRVLGRPLDFRKSWALLTAEVRLIDFHMHDVRHYKAAQLLRAGISIAVAAQIMGHSAAVLEKRYGHLETESLQSAQEKAWRKSSSVSVIFGDEAKIFPTL